MCPRRLIGEKALNLLFITMLLVFGCGQSSAQGGGAPEPQKEKLEGRVFARVNSLMSGTGLGPRYESFVFELAAVHDSNKRSSKLVRILYKYFNQKQELRNDFFDHRLLYELRATRETYCDAATSKFASEQNGVSEPPTSILSILEGADKSLLVEIQILPCYVMSESDYTVVRRNHPGGRLFEN